MGQKATTPESLAVLADLLRCTLRPDGSRALAILPGSGINETTAQSLLDATLPHCMDQLHLSAGEWVQGHMQLRKEGMGMGVGGSGDWGIWRTNATTVRAVRKIVDRAWNNYLEVLND